ncbi:MAG TPA: glycosyltransferase family 2 protein, partial [Candidatus Nitrosotenuis sp.]|nr:glycosyltransferase family 2 protein [Candidatus Nitrosotenuis sp.]
MQQRLSVIVIVKDEEAHLHRCLQSIQWADEIIVLDSGSQDATVEIARKFTPHVFVTDWPGYGVQKNRALAKVTSPWVLSLDADEELTPELCKEIQQLLREDPLVDGFAIRRQSLFCGRWIR